MKTAIIIDDELHCIETLQEKIKLYTPDINIVNTFTNPKSGLEYLESNEPHIVFLDIEMPNINGFALLEKIKEIKFKIVFTTAYDQYAIKAIKFSAFDYLLKPISKDDLIQVNNRLHSANLPIKPEQLNILMQQLYDTKIDELKITIPTSEGLVFPFIKDIVRIESSSNYSTIFFDSNKKLLVSKTLKDFDDLLSPYHFFRVHNSHLINLKKVTKYYKTEGGTIELVNGDKIDISRRRKESFLQMLQVINPLMV